MAQITLTIDLTPETLEVLKLLTTVSNSKPEIAIPESKQMSLFSGSTEENDKKDKKAANKNAAKDDSSEMEKPSPAVTLADVRAAALKLSKAGKQEHLKEIFAKYGAAKLSDISTDYYGDLMADLEEANE